ncbi:redoxin domain-containing protein [Chryseolinea sp. T2]|uniref:redoxin domain-containing protein n=1 Tax=Chryseolinea sp. T2 TaxID=3129255 RepID=UPI0030772C36
MRLPVLIICILLPLAGFAQAGYHLKLKIEGLKDTTVYLGNFYGETTYIKDTARANSRGEFEFKGAKPLIYRGVYFIVLMQNGKPARQFDFLIADKQQFSMETKSSDYVKFMKVTGDPDNTLFFENMVFNSELHKEADPFIKILQDSTQSTDKKKEARLAYTAINEKAMAHQTNVIAKNPNTLTAKILKAHRPVTIPDPPKRKDGSIDSTYQLRWYRKHFFDNFDLAEPGLICLQTPLYKDKINEYLDKLFIQQPDSIMSAMASFIDRAKANQETFKYATWITLLKYQQPDIMGLDEVYVRMYDKYYGSGLMDFWVNDKLKKNLKEHADRMRNSLVGMKAPNLIMQDAAFKAKSMYDIKNKYTVLYIFDPDCGHCKEETPKLVKFYNAHKYDLQVYAVSADTSMQKMRDYIKDMKMPWITVNGPRTYVGPYGDLYDAIVTPSLYIIDDKKKIIAKKVPVDKLDEFFTQYERFKNVEKSKSGKL